MARARPFGKRDVLTEASGKNRLDSHQTKGRRYCVPRIAANLKRKCPNQVKRNLTLIFVLFAGKAAFGATDPATGTVHAQYTLDSSGRHEFRHEPTRCCGSGRALGTARPDRAALSPDNSSTTLPQEPTVERSAASSHKGKRFRACLSNQCESSLGRTIIRGSMRAGNWPS